MEQSEVFAAAKAGTKVSRDLPISRFGVPVERRTGRAGHTRDRSDGKSAPQGPGLPGAGCGTETDTSRRRTAWLQAAKEGLKRSTDLALGR